MGCDKGTPHYKVTFDFNYEGSTASVEEYLEGSQVAEPTAPTRNEYVFGGWYKEKECVNAYDFTTHVKSSFTIYAKWTPFVHINKITIDHETYTCEENDTFTLKITYDPATPTNPKTTWKVSDDKVVKMYEGMLTTDDTRMFTAGKAGTATITVTTEDGNKTATCVVTVEPAK